MNILVTGSNGFVGKNLVENLKCIKEGKNKIRNLQIDNIYEFDINTDFSLLEQYCSDADFVFNLAGVNRPEDQKDYMKGNFGFASNLLECLKKNNNSCPVMLSSSIQATLLGRYEESDYGKSKLAGEKLFFEYGKDTGAKILVYRFPNLFGKWCRPNYNSVIATFCNNIANDLPIRIDNSNTEIELLYIDDLIEEMLDALEGVPHRCDYNGLYPTASENGKYCYCPITYKINLGQVVEKLTTFKKQAETKLIPSIPDGSFVKKLYSTYLSYLPEKYMKIPLKMNSDARGSFTELLKTTDKGQISVNISKPGVAKGNHWHNSKWEFFIVVSGRALIQERKIGTEEIIEFEVSGEKIEAVHMLPGYTHNIINLSDTENLVTVMWANEPFDKEHPDTFFEIV